MTDLGQRRTGTQPAKAVPKRRFMRDELGNLSVDGPGIPGFSRMVAVGLGTQEVEEDDD